MEVEGGRGDKEGVDDQVVRAHGLGAHAVEEDVVVPGQFGGARVDRVVHRDRRVPVLDVVEHPEVVGVEGGDFAAGGAGLVWGGFGRRLVVLVGRVVEDVYVLAVVSGDRLTPVVVHDVVVELGSSRVARRDVVVHDDPVAVGDPAGIGLSSVADVVLVVVDDVVVYEDLGRRDRVEV